MNKILSFINFLKGKKAYIIGVLMVVIGLLQRDTQIVMEGLSVMALRAGIAKTSL